MDDSAPGSGVFAGSRLRNKKRKVSPNGPQLHPPRGRCHRGLAEGPEEIGGSRIHQFQICPGHEESESLLLKLFDLRWGARRTAVRVLRIEGRTQCAHTDPRARARAPWRRCELRVPRMGSHGHGRTERPAEHSHGRPLDRPRRHSPRWRDGRVLSRRQGNPLVGSSEYPTNSLAAWSGSGKVLVSACTHAAG